MNTLLFLEQTVDNTQPAPLWISIIIALIAAITAGLKKYTAVKNSTVPKGTSTFDMIVYLFGKHGALSMVDEFAIADLNNLNDKGELTFEDYVTKLKSIAAEKAYMYITENVNMAKYLDTPAELIKSVDTVVSNLIDSKYDEEALKLLYEIFKDVIPEVKIEEPKEDTPKAE